jgi:hypothetical protein
MGFQFKVYLTKISQSFNSSIVQFRYGYSFMYAVYVSCTIYI